MAPQFRRSGKATSPLTRACHGFPRFLLTAALLTCGCSRTAPPLSVSVIAREIAPQPPQVGPITVTFRLADATKPVSGARVALEGDMTHAGMAPVFGDAREIALGQYQGQLRLNMGGDWVVLMHITLPNGKKLEDQIDVSGVQSE
jgi:hypothetical protein